MSTAPAPVQPTAATKVVLPKSETAAANTPRQPAEKEYDGPPPFTIGHPSDAGWLNLMIYGELGVGKTYFAATADDVPEMQDVLYIDIEAGDLSLIKRRELDVTQINNFHQLARIHEFLILHCQARDANDVDTLIKMEARLKEVDESEIKEPKRYRTVVLDSLTEAQILNLYQLLHVEIDHPLDKIYEPPVFDHWNRTTQMVRRTVRAFRDLPMHVIMVCQLKIDEKDGNSRTIAFPKELSRTLPGFFDASGFLQSSMQGEGVNRRKVRRLELENGAGFKAKHRFVALDQNKPYVENPTVRDLLELRKAGLASAADEK